MPGSRLDSSGAPGEETDRVIRAWLAGKIPLNAPMDAHGWHWRFDCRELEVYEYKYDTHPLSGITADPETCFVVTWGCPHRDERLTMLVRELGSLPEIIAELEEVARGQGSA